jgi:murein DD-endopeptidase MepM/ murein hydrolase activator NlpD
MNTYTVVKGDTLFSIARRFGMSVAELQQVNGLTSPNLRIGQALKVKGTTSNVPPTPPPPAPRPVPPVPQPPVQPPPVVTQPGSDYLANRRQFAIQTRPEAGFQRFFITVPLLNGTTVQAVMRDNINMSRFMVYPVGILYGGMSQIVVDLPMIEAVGLTQKQALALQYVSTHEGKFDAINSYDRGIFSYGFIQFVGAAAHGASLNNVMASMKQQAPSLFARVFQSVGIDSESGRTTVLDERGNRLRGDDAWLYIQRTVSVYGAFVQAGYEPMLVREQLRMANTLYVQPALNFRLNVNIGGIQITIPRLQDILSSEAILTAVIAIGINQGNGGMSRIFSSAIATAAAESGISNMSGLQRINQRRVCEIVASTSTDERVRNRAQGVLDSGLSFV